MNKSIAVQICSVWPPSALFCLTYGVPAHLNLFQIHLRFKRLTVWSSCGPRSEPATFSARLRTQRCLHAFCKRGQEPQQTLKSVWSYGY
ncbi:hypothetical protein AGIG_G3307 [Arapaima gigas]